MKKNSMILWILSLLFGAMMMACVDDRGNYDYLSEKEVMPAVISGLEEKYTLTFGTTETLTATVEGDEGRKNLRYMWYIYKMPNRAERDTLGYGKTLSFSVNLESGSYHMWFEVRDTVADVCVNQKMEVTVETVLSNAWLVVESENGETDLDAVLSDGSTMENVITSSVGSRLKGEAVKVVYIQEHSNEVINPDGTVTVKKQKAFYVLSDQGMQVFNAENMHLLKNSADCFYEAPREMKPMGCGVYTPDMYLINAGKYHSLSGTGDNVGKFSYMKAGPGDAAYNLHREILPAGSYTMVFDQMSRSFLWAFGNNSELGYFAEAPAGSGDLVSLTDMQVELKHLLYRSSIFDWEILRSTYMGYAIMVDEAGKYYLMDISYREKAMYPVKDYKEIPTGCQLGEAEITLAHKTASSIYFVKGNELWVHDVNASQTAELRERKLFTFEGEEITCLRHVKTPVTSTEPLDHLVVMTYSVGNWKLYGFPFIGGGSEIDSAVKAEDVLIGQGKGRAAYCSRLSDNYEY